MTRHLTWMTIAFVGAGCGGDNEPAAPRICDPKILAQLQEGSMHEPHVWSAGLVADACELPRGLESALEQVSQTGECSSAAAGIAMEASLFVDMCPAGHDAAQTFVTHGGSEANRAFAERCELARLGFATLDELAHATNGFCTMLGSMVFVALDEADEPEARRIARRLVLGEW